MFTYFVTTTDIKREYSCVSTLTINHFDISTNVLMSGASICFIDYETNLTHTLR